MARLLITGDTHQNYDIAKLTSRRFPLGNELTKDDIVVILGDAGFVWDNSNEDLYWRKWICEKPWTTFCVLGNHEAYPLLEKFPDATFGGQPVKQIGSSLFYAKTGLVYDLLGKKCLVVNGADSHDKASRKEGKDWWPQERITENDLQIALQSLVARDNTIDYLFTHTGGTEVCNTLGYAASPSDAFIDKIKNTIVGDYQHYCGHYHVNRCINQNTKVLYNDIILLHDT